MIDVRHSGALYLGRVAVRNKFVKQAQLHNCPLKIHHDKNYMLIQHWEIEQRKVGQSVKPISDQFGGAKDYLIYFVWRPQEHYTQNRLFKEV